MVREVIFPKLSMAAWAPLDSHACVPKMGLYVATYLPHLASSAWSCGMQSSTLESYPALKLLSTVAVLLSYASRDSNFSSTMTAPVMKQKLTQINGPDLRRFVLHSALLRLIDPVRGPPTRTLLDENPEGDDSSGPQLKLKFLDSFALICSTSSIGRETASAVCLEQHDSAKTVLRVARNRGFTPDVLASLEQVLELLRLVARKGRHFGVQQFLDVS